MYSSALQKLRRGWHGLPVHYRLYVVAGALAVLAFLLVSIGGVGSSLLSMLMWISSILFGVGFVLWVGPWFKGKWQTSAGKWLLATTHAALIFLSVIVSRHVVASALGLPPQDFDMTVSIFAVELYPALWLLTMTCVGMLVSAIFLMSAGLCTLSKHPLLNDALLLGTRFLAPDSTTRAFIESGRDRFFIRALGHYLGSLVIALCAAYAFDVHAQFLREHLQLIRWVAYATDFQFAPNYPGIDGGKKVRLHENGVVSYAERDGRDIKITVSKFQEK